MFTSTSTSTSTSVSRFLYVHVYVPCPCPCPCMSMSVCVRVHVRVHVRIHVHFKVHVHFCVRLSSLLWAYTVLSFTPSMIILNGLFCFPIPTVVFSHWLPWSPFFNQCSVVRPEALRETLSDPIVGPYMWYHNWMAQFEKAWRRERGNVSYVITTPLSTLCAGANELEKEWKL